MNLVRNAVAALVLGAPFAAARAQSPAFDGQWSVTLICEQAADGALGYSYQFPAEVKNGVLHGENGVQGTPTWLSVDGTIPADGAAMLLAHGLTGSSRDYNVGRVSGKTPYGYHIKAQFNGAQGEGVRLETRPCKMYFHRS